MASISFSGSPRLAGRDRRRDVAFEMLKVFIDQAPSEVAREEAQKVLGKLRE